MIRSEFHARIEILQRLDMRQLVAAGVISDDDTASWRQFRQNPFQCFLRAPAERAERLWALTDQFLSPAGSPNPNAAGVGAPAPTRPHGAGAAGAPS